MDRAKERALKFGKLVSHTAHGLDVARVLGIGLNLLADALDVYVRRAGFAVEIPVPELLNDLLAAVDPSGVRREKAEDFELRGGEIDLFSVNPDLTARKIDH